MTLPSAAFVLDSRGCRGRRASRPSSRSGRSVEQIVSATLKSYVTEARHVLQPGRRPIEARDLVRELTGARFRVIDAAS